MGAGSDGWKHPNGKKVYNLDEIDENKYKDKTFYKSRWIKEKGLEQQLIVSFSFKYKSYQEKRRAGQLERAEKLIATNSQKLEKSSQQDCKRFIQNIATTKGGELAEQKHYFIDESIIKKEAMYDGFYAVCTNLDETDIPDIIRINHRRWEIEESFHLLKHEFKARPVYLQRDDRIKAHFTTCFLALTLFRILEKRLKEQFTAEQIVDTLRGMDMVEMRGQGFIPAYTRTDLTDALHEIFNFRTDFQITTLKNMKKIFKQTQK